MIAVEDQFKVFLIFESRMATRSLTPCANQGMHLLEEKGHFYYDDQMPIRPFRFFIEPTKQRCPAPEFLYRSSHLDNLASN